MKKFRNTLPYLALLLPSGVALYLYGYLGSFTRFIADDYCSAIYARDLGFVGSILFWYRTWSGRYSAFGMDWLVLTKLFGMYSIQLVPPVIMVIWLVFAFATINSYLKSIAPERNNLFPAIVLAVCSVYVVLALSPNVPQSLYWWNGFRSYTLPLVVLTIYTFFFQLISKQIQTTKQLIFWGILSFLFLFASGGLSETYAVLQFVLLVFLIVLKVLSLPRNKANPELILLLAGLLGTILSLLVIISAPGNAIRQSRLTSQFDLSNFVFTSLSGYANFVFDLFGSAYKLAGLLGAVFVFIWIGMQYKNMTIRPWKILAYFIAGFMLSFACILPGVYGYAQLPPARTMIIPVFILTICLLLSGFLAGSWLANQSIVPTWSKNGLMVLACALLVFSGAITSRTLYESRSDYLSFARKWDTVDAQILEAKASGEKSVEIPDMSNWSGLDRPNQYQDYWLTECYTGLYGIQVYGPPFPWEQ
jgi:hypothetical protein